MLAKTAGVKHLVVLVNKMDDPTVNWDEARYVPFLNYTFMCNNIILRYSFLDTTNVKTRSCHILKN